MLGVRDVDVVLRGHVQHARAPHVLEQRRLVASAEQALEEHALAQPRLGRLEAVEAAGPQHALHDDRAGEDQVGARRLDARDARALGGGQRREPLDELVERLALDHHALHAVGRQPRGALRGGGEVAHGAADADQAPAALRRRPRPATAPARARAATCSRSSSSCLRLAGPFGGRKRSLIRTVPSAPGARLAARAARHAHELQRAAAEVEHAAVVSVVELTAAR